MTWLAALPTILVSALIILVPGLAIGYFIRLRGLWLYALAPAISITTLSLASVVLPWLGLSWTPVTAGLFALVFGAAVVALFRLVFRARFAREDGPAWPMFLGWGVGAALLASYSIIGIGNPENISQTFDNVFHLNTVAWIAENGNASPFAVGALIAPQSSPSFYPDIWNALVQLTQQLGGTTIPVAINAFNVAAAAIIWPLGILLLTRQVAGSHATTALSAGVLAAALPAGPLNMLDYGVLYPYFLAITLAPTVLALVINLLGVGQEPRIALWLPVSVLLLGTLPAIVLSHPAAFMGVLAFSVPVVLVAAFSRWRTIDRRARMWRLAGLIVFVTVGLVLLDRLRPGDQWGPRFSVAEAAWQTASLSLMGFGAPLLIAALVVAGLILSFRLRASLGVATLGMWIIGAALFFVTAGVSNYFVRLPTGVWYGDTPRLAALFPVVVIPVAAFALSTLLRWLMSRSRRSRLVGAAGLIVALVGSQVTAGYGEFLTHMRGTYTFRDNSPLLSEDELELLERLPEHVAEDEMIVGSPWTGTALAYALAGREVIMPHIFMKTLGPERELILEKLRDGTPDVCAAAQDLNVNYVLDFGEREVHGGRHVYTGIEDAENSSVLELVDSEGEAKLYEVTGCN